MQVKHLAAGLATAALLTVGAGVAYAAGPQDGFYMGAGQGYGQMMGYGNMMGGPGVQMGYGNMMGPGFSGVMDREEQQDILRIMQSGDQREMQRFCAEELREQSDNAN